MSDFYAQIDKTSISDLDLLVPKSGIWTCKFITTDKLINTSGLKTIKIDSLNLNGTIIPFLSGEFIGKFEYILIGGYYGWQKVLKQNFYHNDAGIKLKTILSDCARECGENLIENNPPVNKLEEIYYVRKSQPASKTINQLIQYPTQLWVDYDGNSHIGVRPTNLEIKAEYQVLSFDPTKRTALLSGFDLSEFQPGAIIKAPSLTEEFIIKNLEIKLRDNQIKIIAGK